MIMSFKLARLLVSYRATTSILEPRRFKVQRTIKKDLRLKSSLMGFPRMTSGKVGWEIVIFCQH